MREYTIYFTTTAVTDVIVEAESYDEAVERAWDGFQPPVADHVEDFDLSGDWELDDVASDPDYDDTVEAARDAYVDHVADILRSHRGLTAVELARFLAAEGLLNLPN